MNNQQISSVDLDTNTLLVHSIFLTIQGEGPFSGQPATFLRLAGCNLQCPECDTEYTKGATRMNYTDIAHDISEVTRRGGLVVISGGEPFRQNILPIIYLLMSSGYRVQVETNGTLPPHGKLLTDITIVCSPKTGSVNKDLIPYISAYKYVLTAGEVDWEDGLPISVLGHSVHKRVARPHEGFTGPVYVQPADNGNSFDNALNLNAAVKSSMTFGHTLQLQIHKIIGVE